MSRTPNSWRFFTESGLISMVQDLGITGLADSLGVSRSTVDRWVNCDVIPSSRFQVAMVNLRSDFTNLGSFTIGRKIRNFIEATRIDRDEFADLMNVTDRTVGDWITGRSRPRDKTLLSAILTSPRP